jgi:hypothetical protein
VAAWPWQRYGSKVGCAPLALLCFNNSKKGKGICKKYSAGIFPFIIINA